MADVLTALRARTRSHGGQPMVTYVDAESGERTELSATSVENAASKVANALREEFDLDAGARIALRIPVHWQRSAWTAGALVAGCVVDSTEGPPTAADLVVSGPDASTGLRSVERDVAVVSLHPFGLPIDTPLPVGYVDVTLAVRQQPDGYLYEPPRADSPAWMLPDRKVLTQDALLAAATERASTWGLEPGGRLLVGPEADSQDAWLAAFVVPLAVAASVVLVRGQSNRADVMRQEQPTAIIGWSPRR